MGARLVDYKEDEIIISEGEISGKMFLVLEGQVTLYMNYGMENEYVIGVCGRGKVFGEMGLLIGEASLFTAVAFSDVKLAWFEKRNLEQFIIGYPSNAVGLMEKVARSNVLLKKNLDFALEEVGNLKNEIEGNRQSNSFFDKSPKGRMRTSDNMLNDAKKSFETSTEESPDYDQEVLRRQIAKISTIGRGKDFYKTGDSSKSWWI